MNRLKLILSFTGLLLVIASLVLDVAAGRPELGRMVGWAAILFLIGAVALRLIERKGGGEKGGN